MDGVHGVDVSWLHHHSNKHEHLKPKKSSSSSPSKSQQPERRPPSPPSQNAKPKDDRRPGPPPPQPPDGPIATPPATPPTPIPTKSSGRKGLLHRASSEKLSSAPSSPEETRSSKRPNWISSLSSKFSSSQAHSLSSSPQNNKEAKQSAPPLKSPSKEPPTTLIADGSDGAEELEPYVPQQPKSGNFFSSAIRRLSSSSQQPATGRLATQGTTCRRQVLNVDKNRQRCIVKELNQRKLQRVAFSVDVEVVGVSRYAEAEEPVDPSKKAKDKKMQARSEGEALKNPLVFKQEKEKLGAPANPQTGRSNSSGSIDDILESEMLAAAKQQEAEVARQKRREKKEKIRREAEAHGTVAGSDETLVSPMSPMSPKAPKEPPATPQGQDRPTTDPVRMYRRCCQLREAPVLKRISEQLGNMRAEVEKTGIVPCLDLNGSRMQLPDIVCLGDWLAIVPVKRLLLDNANLTDEGVRIILAGLLAAKSPDQSRRKRSKSSPTRIPAKRPQPSPGVVEKLSLRMNTKLTSEGWRYICLFLHLSQSLKAIDMSMTPFPSSQSSIMARGAHDADRKPESNPGDIAHVLHSSLVNRSTESHLEELILSDCGLNTYSVSKVVDAVSGSGINRLGVAKNQLDLEAVQHIARYVRSGSCKGLDIGGNDIREGIDVLARSMSDKTPIWALSVADCNLNPPSLARLIPPLLHLPDFRFLDLSHNKDLFNVEPSALHTLTQYLPRLNQLRRVQFNDVAMLPQQAIAIADIIPEMRNLNHIGLLENPELVKLASTKDLEGQEEACAFYASLMIAVRISKTLLAVDVDEPTSDTNEVIQALHKQIIAYAFRNIDRYTSANAMASDDPYRVIPDKVEPCKEVQVPDILAHLVGHDDADAFVPDESEPLAPDQDYIVGGTGVVKALGYVLNQRSQDSRRVSTAVGGAVTPTQGTAEERAAGKAKAREMAVNMLGSARKIRCRLRLAMQNEANQEDDAMLRRLQFLDQTLQTMIARFESEYPECAAEQPVTTSVPFAFGGVSMNSTRPRTADAAFEPGPEPIDPTDDSQHTPNSSPAHSRANSEADSAQSPARPSSIDVSQLASLSFHGEFPPPASRRTSTTSLAARAQALEEGQMHRFSQKMKRDVLPSADDADDGVHEPSRADPEEPEHLQALRKRLEQMGGDEIRQSVLDIGLDATVRRWGEEADRIERTSTADGADVVDDGSDGVR